VLRRKLHALLRQTEAKKITWRSALGFGRGTSRKEESKMQAQDPGKMIDATTTTFQDMVLSSSTPVAVDFWAPW